MVWRMANIGRLIVIIAFSIAILLSAFGLPVTANGSQNSAQSNPGGYVKYTLDLINNTLINGNFVVYTGNAKDPWGIAYDPSNGYIYVADVGSNTVSVINSATNTVIATIPVGKGPARVTYDPSNGYIYVADVGSNTVSVINGTTVIATIPVGSEPWGIAYDPSNGYIYVADWFERSFCDQWRNQHRYREYHRGNRARGGGVRPIQRLHLRHQYLFGHRFGDRWGE